MKKIIRFLHGYKFDNEATLNAIRAQLEWEKKYLPVDLTEIGESIIVSLPHHLESRSHLCLWTRQVLSSEFSTQRTKTLGHGSGKETGNVIGGHR